MKDKIKEVCDMLHQGSVCKGWDCATCGIANGTHSTGIRLPDECLRGIECRPLAQIRSEGDASYFCCGENNEVEDKWSLCFKNEHCNSHTQNDKRDLAHQMAVIAQALAVIEEEGR